MRLRYPYIYSLRRSRGLYGGLPNGDDSARVNPNSARSRLLTNASITLTGFSSLI